MILLSSVFDNDLGLLESWWSFFFSVFDTTRLAHHRSPKIFFFILFLCTARFIPTCERNLFLALWACLHLRF